MFSTSTSSPASAGSAVTSQGCSAPSSPIATQSASVSPAPVSTPSEHPTVRCIPSRLPPGGGWQPGARPAMLGTPLAERHAVGLGVTGAGVDPVGAFDRQVHLVRAPVQRLLLDHGGELLGTEDLLVVPEVPCALEEV